MTKDDEKGMDDYLKVLDDYFKAWEKNKKSPENKLREPAIKPDAPDVKWVDEAKNVIESTIPSPGFEFNFRDVEDPAAMRRFVGGIKCRYCGDRMLIDHENGDTTTVRCKTPGCPNNPDLPTIPMPPIEEVREAIEYVKTHGIDRNINISVLRVVLSSLGLIAAIVLISTLVLQL